VTDRENPDDTPSNREEHPILTTPFAVEELTDLAAFAVGLVGEGTAVRERRKCVDFGEDSVTPSLRDGRRRFIGEPEGSFTVPVYRVGLGNLVCMI
jgi:hypothetical protein